MIITNRFIKKDKLLNNKKKNRRVIAVITPSIFIVTILLNILVPYQVFGSSKTNKLLNENYLIPNVSKTANDIGDGKFEIELIVKGSDITQRKNADFILVMDSSGSMLGEAVDYHEVMRDSVTGFVTTMLGESENHRISVIDFSGSDSIGLNGKLEDANIVSEFSSNAEEINQKVDARSAIIKSTTNMDAAYRMVKTQLEKSIKDYSDRERYVLFFTDGVPTSSVMETGDGSENDPLWGYTVEGRQYSKIENDFQVDSIFYKSPFNAVVDTYNTIKGEFAYKKLKNTKVYTILLENFDFQSDKIANKLFGMREEEFEEGIYIRSGGKINDGNNYSTYDYMALDYIYDKIANEIITSHNLVNNAIIIDTVTDEFSIIENQYDINGDYSEIGSITSVVTNLKTGELMTLNPIIDNNTISWDVGGIPVEGISIKFIIKVKDDYFGGSGIATNVEATLDYTDHNGDNNSMIFPVPEVNIPYKKGSITVRKEIVKQNELGEWIKVEDSKVKLNDRFSISVVGNQKYTVDLIGNTKSTMSFYLKDNNTDISNNTDMSLNYFTIGDYNIEEIIPMNYELVDIWIDQTPDGLERTWSRFEDYVKSEENISLGKARDGKIVIDRNNPNINIKLTNTVVNESYWRDKANSVNKLNYK